VRPAEEPRRLSSLQLAVLRVLWEAGEARVSEVHGALARDRKMALTTAATLLSRLEKRGLLAHRLEGRQYVYRALVTADEVRRSMLAELTDELFRGRTSELVAHLLDAGEIAPGDLARIKRLIEERERG